MTRRAWRPVVMVVLGYLGHELLEVLEAEPIDYLMDWLIHHWADG